MRYDLGIIGGGLGGASLATVMAERGHRVLVLERQTRYRDRVRGEQMHPWGVAAAKALGVYDRLSATCGHLARWWVTFAGGAEVTRRDLDGTTRHRVGSFQFYHPAMQETLADLASASGATVLRGASAEGIEWEPTPAVLVRRDGRTERVECRIVVGADGRSSPARSWGGFTTGRDPENLMIAGLLVSGSRAPDDGVYVGAGVSTRLLLAPLGDGRARVYLIYQKSTGVRPYDGEAAVPGFLDACRDAGVPPEWLAHTKAAGPLAQFSGADRFVNHPARRGLALIGDAAASPDPSWGTGLSLTLLDVLHLSRCLTQTDDWDAALEDYASAHDGYYHALRAVEAWFTGLIWTDGSEADARRAELLPRLRNEPTRMPDIIGLGPESPIDESGDVMWKIGAAAGT